MRFLFVSAPLPGHLDWGGYLNTAVELQRNGHTVLWASGQAVMPVLMQASLPFHRLQETGWRWPPPPPLQPSSAMDAATLQRLRAERALDQWLDEDRVTQATVELLDLARAVQPDVLVSEMFISAAGIVAEVVGKRFVVAGWPALYPKVTPGNEAAIQLARERLQRLCAQFAVSGVNWTADGPPALLSPTLHISYWSPSWHRGLALLRQTRHVGGVAAPSNNQLPAWPNTKPWVFITLGTSFGNDLNFFIAAARAANELGCLPILALGGQLSAVQRQTLRQQLPDDAVIEELIDLNRVLPNVAAAIHHGGAGVTHALITHAIPQIVVPHAADQSHQAQGVSRSSVGFHLPAKEATAARMEQTLAQILPDLAIYRSNAQALQAEFAELGGVQTAATLLVKIAG